MNTDIERVCNRWIVEYDFWRMWNEFSKSGTVDQLTIYDRRGNPHPENFGDRKIHGYRLLIHFMCKIVEAANEKSADSTSLSNQHDVVTRAKTTLEEAVDLLDFISNSFTRLESDELGEVERCLRRYAVLLPLLRDDQTTAKVNTEQHGFVLAFTFGIEVGHRTVE